MAQTICKAAKRLHKSSELGYLNFSFFFFSFPSPIQSPRSQGPHSAPCLTGPDVLQSREAAFQIIRAGSVGVPSCLGMRAFPALCLTGPDDSQSRERLHKSSVPRPLNNLTAPGWRSRHYCGQQAFPSTPCAVRPGGFFQQAGSGVVLAPGPQISPHLAPWWALANPRKCPL